MERRLRLPLPKSVTFVSIIAILPAILGNILILLAIRKTSSILLGSLAFTDLGVGLLAQPLYAVKTLSSAVSEPDV